MREGVCDGIAKSVKAFCDMMGIHCIVIRGEARQESGNVESHAWNAIKLDGEWRFFDFTFQQMDYFALSYEEMSTDHFKWSADICGGDRGEDYFRRNNLVVHKQEDINRIICGSSLTPIECAFKVDAAWKRYNNSNALEQAVQNLIDRAKVSYRYSYFYNRKGRFYPHRIECC